MIFCGILAVVLSSEVIATNETKNNSLMKNKTSVEYYYDNTYDTTTYPDSYDGTYSNEASHNMSLYAEKNGTTYYLKFHVSNCSKYIYNAIACFFDEKYCIERREITQS
jgi:hypothetical protein